MEHGDTATTTATAMAMDDDCDDATMAMPAPQHDAPCDDSVHKHGCTCHGCMGCSSGAVAPPPFFGKVPVAFHVAYEYVFSTTSFDGWVPPRIERPPRF
jgi:hypothetical protein